MMRRPIRYSEAERRFIDARHTMPRRALHTAFVAHFGRGDVTLENVQTLCTRNGWQTGRARWRPEDDARLRELYPEIPTTEVARRLGRTLSATYGHANRLGLAKSEAYLARPAACRLRRGDNVGAASRFTKGHVPANKGKKMPYHPNSAATRFKKGVRQGVAVTLYKPIGTERLSKDGYLERKINDGMPLQSRWRAVHRIRWEALHGRVPEGMALKALDGTRLNTEPENWALVPRALLPRLNGIHGRNYDHAPAALKPTILAVAKLEHAARTTRRTATGPTTSIHEPRIAAVEA